MNLQYLNFYLVLLTFYEESISKKIHATRFGINSIDFDPTRRTVVTIHGLIPQIYSIKLLQLRQEFLHWGDINLIEVSWDHGSTDPIKYVKAVLNTEYAAIKTKELIGRLIEAWKRTTPLENWGPLHIIGHSLGAHVAGQTAELLKQEYDLLVDRVTGLDPAGPCFHDPNLRLRLKKSNARFVDVIHTDGGTARKFRFGLLVPIGHIDFYVNGGSFQPGCLTRRHKRESINLIQIGHHLIGVKGICQHLRAYSIFTESLKQAVRGQCKFWAHPWYPRNLETSKPPRRIDSCNNRRCIEMGINAEHYRNDSGLYYVTTTSASPYCSY